MSAIDNANVAQRMMAFATQLVSVQVKMEDKAPTTLTKPTTGQETKPTEPTLDVEDSLVKSTGELFKQKCQLEELVAKTDAGAKAIFDVQMGEINKTFSALVDKVEPAFNKGCERTIVVLDGEAKKLLVEIAQCFSSGRFAAIEKLGETAKKLNERVEALMTTPKTHFGKDLSPALKSQIEKLQKPLQDELEAQAKKLSPVEDPGATRDILENLSKLIKSKDPIKEADRASWNEQIAKAFSKDTIVAIDGEVYKLSQDPKKGGLNWGFEHRFDDLSCLQQAIANVVSRRFQALIDSEGFPIKGDKEIQNAVYAGVYKDANSPAAKDPIAWAKENVAFHLDVALETIHGCLEKREIALQQKEEALVALQNLEHILVLPLSEKGKQMAMEPKFKQLPENVKHYLFGKIWDLAAEYRKNEDKWSEKHYADNLLVLQLAVEAAIVANGGVVNTATEKAV